MNRNWPSSSWSAGSAEQRYNQGIKPLSEPENILLFNLFKWFKPTVIFSYHSWCPLLDHNPGAKQIVEYIAKYNNYQVVDYIGYPTPGSLGSYVDEYLNCGIITYELPSVSAELSIDVYWAKSD